MKITLKAARINAGLSLKEAADGLGITENSLKNIESGRRDIKVLEFKAMSLLYKVPMDSFIVPTVLTNSEL